MPEVATRHYSLTYADSQTSIAIEALSASSAAFLFNLNVGRAGRTEPFTNNVPGQSGTLSLSALNDVVAQRDVTFGTIYKTFATVEYTGAAGGQNEFVNRGNFAIGFTGTTLTAVSTTISGVNLADCVPFLSGIRHSEDNKPAGWYPKLDCISVAANHVQIRAIRNHGSVSALFAVALVEFTGANWNVVSGSKSASGSAVTDVASISDIIDWDTAFIWATKQITVSADAAGAAAGLTPLVAPGTTTTSIRLRQPAGSSPVTGVTQFYVIRNPQLAVRHRGIISGDLSFSAGTGSLTTQSIAVSVTAVISLSAALPVAYAVGTGFNDYYSGNYNVMPRATNSVVFSRTQSTNTGEWQMAMIDFSGVTTTASSSPSPGVSGLALSPTDTLEKPLLGDMEQWQPDG